MLEAAVHGHPGVGHALAGHVFGATPGLVLDEGFDPGVFDAHGADLAAGDKGDVGDAALPQHLLGSIDGLGATDPVHHLFGRHFDAAVDVARRDAAGPEQRYQQAGGVHGVAGLFVQGVLRALHAALGGLPVDVVVNGLGGKPLALPIAPAHPVWSKHGSAFNHGSKLASALFGQALTAMKFRAIKSFHAKPAIILSWGKC